MGWLLIVGGIIAFMILLIAVSVWYDIKKPDPESEYLDQKLMKYMRNPGSQEKK